MPAFAGRTDVRKLEHAENERDRREVPFGDSAGDAGVCATLTELTLEPLLRTSPVPLVICSGNTTYRFG